MADSLVVFRPWLGREVLYQKSFHTRHVQNNKHLAVPSSVREELYANR